MKIAIVGSRNFKDLSQVDEFVKMLPEDSIVISGGARGVDTAAEIAARAYGLGIEVYLPDYAQYPGKVAPLKRNETIAEKCNKMVCFWDGRSTGSAHAMSCARRLGKPVQVVGG